MKVFYSILRVLFIVVILFAKTNWVVAQEDGRGSVKLKLVNEKLEPVALATVSLLQVKDSVLKKTAVANDAGIAEMEGLKPGDYFISITAAGLNTYTSTPFQVSTAQLHHDLATIVLTAKTTQMNEVVVASKKPFIERQLDKLVINVQSSITAAGSSAFEVLEKAPGVVIDNNDNISMKGRPGVMVMINGKPSVISGSDLGNYLRGLPANAIEKIELISNPSSRYDAAGNSGIINIVMKKDQRLGTNGTITASYGQGRYPKTGQGITFNHRNKKLNIFGNYNFAYRKAFSHLTLYRSFYKDGQPDGVFDQDNFITFPFKNHIARVGADYSLSDKTVVGVVVNGVSNQYHSKGHTHSDILNNTNTLVGVDKNYSSNKDHWFNVGINANLKHKFDSLGSELNIDMDYARFGNNTNQDFTTSFYDNTGNTIKDDYILLGDIDGHLNIQSIKADYIKMLTGKAKLELGIKSSLVRADNDLAYYDASSGSPVFDPNQSNHFIYDENINAAYLSFGKELNKFNFQAGLRVEHTAIKGNQLATNQKFDSSYVNLFPSAFVNYKLAKKHELGISVSRRLNRPNYRQLNPFKFFINNTTYSEGNPYLRPQYTYSFEFSHTYNQRITTTLLYSITKENITQVIFPSEEEDKITIQTDRNLAQFEFYGVNISAPIQITPWWNSVNTVNVYYGLYRGSLANTNLRNGNVNFNINTNNSFVIGKKGYSAELTGVYRAAEVYGFMKVRPVGQLAIGAQKTILKGKGTVRFNVSDIFYTQVSRATIDFRDYSETFNVKRESRVATLSFTWRFGNNKVAASRRRTSGAEEERQRAASN
jgi:hypothetical protein